jgi:hypothetical protein
MEHPASSPRTKPPVYSSRIVHSVESIQSTNDSLILIVSIDAEVRVRLAGVL